MAEITPGIGAFAEDMSSLALAWVPDRDGDANIGTHETVATCQVGEPCFGSGLLDFSLHIEPDPGGPPRESPVPSRRANSDGDPPKYPVAGDVVAHFRILAQLGRGAFARVYLAEQIELADRPVAIKVTAEDGEESRTLARLQHAHIVPIHSVHLDPKTGLRVICMPYLGGANLAEVLSKVGVCELAAGAGSATNLTGRRFLEALDELDEESLPDRPDLTPTLGGDSHPRGPEHPGRRAKTTRSRSNSVWNRYFARLSVWSDLDHRADLTTIHATEAPARSLLQSASLVQAATWITARLAEALEHAHERGILHRDIKPSNILITADVTPMLLDFNLSVSVAHGDACRRAHLGGTLPYMAPEHLDAFDPNGQTPIEAVGPAADLYSLGLILYEMCAGVPAFAEPPTMSSLSETIRFLLADRRAGAPSIRLIDPQVPRSLDSILQKCLDADPDRRYRHAGHLAEDLRRFLDDRPLLHAPDPSLRERLEKWSRRHPRASSSTCIGFVAMLLISFLSMAAWSLRQGYESSAAHIQQEVFTRGFHECQLLLNTTSGPTSHLVAGLVKADRCLGLYGIDLEGRWLDRPLVRRLPPAERAYLLRDLSELIQLRSRALAHEAGREEASQPGRRDRLLEALSWLNTAERFDPEPSAAFYRTRAALHQAFGEIPASDSDCEHAAKSPIRSARDHDQLGTTLLAESQLDRAEAELNQAVTIDPQRFWSWFALGICHYEQRRFQESAFNFEVCAVLAPEFAWPHHNRGQALASANRRGEARTAFDRALALAPDFVEALISRGLTALELDDPEQAERDLMRAMELGRHDSATRAAHAETIARLGRREQAERDFERALADTPNDVALLVARGFFHLADRQDLARAGFEKALKRLPSDSRAHLGMAHLLRTSDPNAALAHLDRSLEIDPDFGDALQLRALLRAHQGSLSAVLDADRLEGVPTPHRLYNAACALAILFDKTHIPRHADRAIELLARAIQAGFSPNRAASDPDFACLHDSPDFQALFTNPAPGS